MKIHAKLVTSVFLLSLTGYASPSNPDSEIAQSGGKRSMETRSVDDLSSFAVINDKYSGFKVLRPFFTSFGEIWREVASSSGEDSSVRIRDRGGYVDIFRVASSNRSQPNRMYGIKGPSRVQPPPFRSETREPTPDRRVTTGPVPSSSSDRASGKNAVSNPSIKTRNYPTPPKPQNDQSHRPRPGRPSPDASLFAGIVNNFAFKMVETMKLESSFVISPLSIYVALSMCYLGAEGKTKTQLEEALGLNEYSVHGLHLHQGISDLLSMFSPESDTYQLSMATGMFLGKNFTTEESFIEDLRKFYNAGLKNVDFSDQAGSLRIINDWVDKHTGGAIPQIIKYPLPPLTNLVLLNAIFFKGVWKTQFPLDATFKGQFYSLDGTEETVSFMTLYREMFPVHRSDEHRHTFLKLPYQGDQVSMIIALPYTHQEPPMPTVTDEILCHMRDAMKNITLSSVSVPRFRQAYLESLREPLMRMGIRDVFGDAVDLTKMRKQNDVHVSDILHKAIIDVNEQGTTAAAATAVQLVPLSANMNDFVANHPFAFYVVHEPSGLVLFYGKMYDIREGPLSFAKEEDAIGPREGYRVPQRNRWEDRTQYMRRQ